MVIQLIVGQGVTHNRIFLRKCARWSKAPLSPRAIREIVARSGKLAGLPFVPRPHQLRHACGYYLASHGHDTRAIQDYLGHRNIQHTVRYTAMAPHRFEHFWTD
jgi:type 1 fimbriae regulatory protein FimB/type 1 fimbriae regulatory protein FimE